jgi:hypothetical protein
VRVEVRVSVVPRLLPAELSLGTRNGDFCLFLAIFVEHAHRLTFAPPALALIVSFIESRKRTVFKTLRCE